jgi:hypothetical protein
LHASLKDKLLSLPDDIEVYPAHFAGSACGKAMSGKRPRRSGSSGASTRRCDRARRPSSSTS